MDVNKAVPGDSEELAGVSLEEMCAALTECGCEPAEIVALLWKPPTDEERKAAMTELGEALKSYLLRRDGYVA